MAYDKQIYLKVLNEYKDKKRIAEINREILKNKIYQKIPEIEAIDNQIADNGLELIKKSIGSGVVISEEIEKIKQKNSSLKEQKNKILRDNGYESNVFDIKYECYKCKDEGFIDNKMCDCFKKRTIYLAYEKSNLSALLKNQSFDKFDLSLYPKDLIDKDTNLSAYETMLASYHWCSEFVKDFDNHKMSLLFYGKPGLGKTFMSTCIAKALLDEGKSVIYQSASKIFQMLEEYKFGRSINPEETKEKLDMLYISDLLILDDLGTEFVTAYTNSAFFDIVNTRILENKHTIISTNYSPRDMQKVYSERVISRIMGYYFPIKFFGEDIRVKQK